MATDWANYKVEELAEGVFAAIHRPGGVAICNSGIVDLGEGGLVFDTSCASASSKELGVVAATLLGRPPALAANSHWHVDHSLGNQHFSGLPIWGTRRTREILLEKREELIRELAPSEIAAALQQLEARRVSMPAGLPQRDLEFTIQFIRAIGSSGGKLEPHPPDRTFETHHTLPGSRGARLLSFGSGHTEADAILYLPHERVIFAGDLVCLGIQPSMGSGDPEHWLKVLDELERLGAERVVPGHGPVSGPEKIQETRDYVSGVLEAARQPVGKPLPSTIRGWEGSVSLEDNLTFARNWVSAHAGGQ